MEHQSAWNFLTDIGFVMKIQKIIEFPAYNLPFLVNFVRFAPAILRLVFILL